MRRAAARAERERLVADAPVLHGAHARERGAAELVVLVVRVPPLAVGVEEAAALVVVEDRDDHRLVQRRLGRLRARHAVVGQRGVSRGEILQYNLPTPRWGVCA